MKSLAVCAILLAIGVSYFYMTSTSSRSPIEEQYQLFLAEYGKSVANGEEYQMRLRIFEDNLKKIEEINSQQNSYQLGINKFADMTEAEYKKMLGYIPIKNKQPAKAFTEVVADAIDWRTKGAVNGVQNQGNCGSCWAFSATAAFEGAFFAKNGTLVKFSEQQLVDCSSAFGNEGCNGGLMDSAFDYLNTTNFCTAASYQYTAKDGKCKSSTCGERNATTIGHVDVAQNSTAALRDALNNGPVSVAIEADKLVFQFYTSGIFNNTRCGDNLDHGVTLVGFGTDAKSHADYWIVRNSWGSSWGESGYIRIDAHNIEKKGGLCGILLDSSRLYSIKKILTAIDI